MRATISIPTTQKKAIQESAKRLKKIVRKKFN